VIALVEPFSRPFRPFNPNVIVLIVDIGTQLHLFHGGLGALLLSLFLLVLMLTVVKNFGDRGFFPIRNDH